MSKLIESIESIKSNLGSGLLEKKEYHSLLFDLEKELEVLFDLSGYDYNKTRTFNLFKLDEDERLDNINNLENEFNDNKKIAISEAVEYWDKVFSDFLFVYYLGFCHSFKLDKRGFFEIEISCLIHSGFGSENKESNRINFENQMNKLKSMGFLIDKSRHGEDSRLLDTGKNHDLIKELLKERGAKMIVIESMDDEIRKIKFSVSAINIDKFKVKKELFSFIESETLNLDEIIKLKKLCSEIISSASFMSGELLHTCGSLVESYFADMCKTLDFEGKIRKTKEARHSLIRQKNIKIHNKKELLGEKVPLEELKNGAVEISESLDGYFANKLGFTLNEFEVQKYGGIKASFRFVGYDYYGKGKLIEVDDLKRIYKTIGNTRKNEDLYILDNEENRISIENFLLQISSLNIISIDSIYKNNLGIINGFVVVIDDIKSILNLEFEKDDEY